jgi:channel protein, hemolysin III family
MISKLKDPGSAITHFIGIVMALIAALPLILKAQNQTIWHLISCIIFITSMILLYTASTLYHSLDLNAKMNTYLKKLDHIMIFILIAGTYTPICIIALQGKTGQILLGLVWGIALIGILIKAFWVYCPKWFSSIIYIALGWLCILASPQMYHTLTIPALIWLIAGGITYTIGGILYAIKFSIFNSKHKNFGSHEIFHLFVIGGSLCHYIVIYFYILNIPFN